MVSSVDWRRKRSFVKQFYSQREQTLREGEFGLIQSPYGSMVSAQQNSCVHLRSSVNSLVSSHHDQKDGAQL